MELKAYECTCTLMSVNVSAQMVITRDKECLLICTRLMIVYLILKTPQIMAPLTDAAKMIQEAEESGKSLLEVSASVMKSTKFEVGKLMI